MGLNENTTTVRDFAATIPGATRLFEQFGIDYCCGGARPLAEVCAERGIDAGAVLEGLNGLKREAEASPVDRDFAKLSMTELMEHIVSKHHEFTRSEIERIGRLLEKVIAAHGERHAEIAEIQTNFQTLAAELMPHMMKEEHVLFPYISQVELYASRGAVAPAPMFGTVQNPVRMMSIEHETAGAILEKMRALSGGYVAPADACPTFTALYEALDGLERDLHEHIHLENNLLFPRAIATEKGETTTAVREQFA